MLLRQIEALVISPHTHLPLPPGCTHVLIANDGAGSNCWALGALYTAEEGTRQLMHWRDGYADPGLLATMNVLYYDLEAGDIEHILKWIADGDVAVLRDEMRAEATRVQLERAILGARG